MIVENVNWKWQFSDSYGGDVILRIIGCNIVILLTVDNSFLFLKFMKRIYKLTRGNLDTIFDLN